MKEKSKLCSEVLQLMDKDYSYEEALLKVFTENKHIDIGELETELSQYI